MMERFRVQSAINAVKVLSHSYDLVTLPLYIFLQRPWEKQRLSKQIRAKAIAKNERSITYRNIANQPGKCRMTVERLGIDTIEKSLRYAADVYGEKRCLGTRQILAEEDEVQPDGSVLKKYKMGDYKWMSFTDVERLAASFGRGLKELGLTREKNVVIFAETRAEWKIAAHACFKNGLTVVTVFTTLHDEGIVRCINETEVDTVITSHDLLPKLKSLLPMTPEVENVIYMEDQLVETDTTGFSEDVKVMPFSDVMRLGANSTVELVTPKTDDIAIIMYTSGSTGVPKGVTLTHKNVMSTVKAGCDSIDFREDDVYLGYLPLAHAFELCSEAAAVLNGSPIGYSSPLTMIDSSKKIMSGCKGDVSLLQPTFMPAVPLVLNQISKGINKKVEESSPLSRAIFKFAHQYKLKWTERGYETPILDKLIFASTRQLLGGRLRLIISGGAPLAPETQIQIKNYLCATLAQGFASTETCASATLMTPHDRSIGRVGAPNIGCDLRLENWEEGNYKVSDKPHPRGEIIIGGDNVSPGYYKMPEKTKEDFFYEDGQQWFKTGDIGEIHPDGCMKIIDRKKDLVKLQHGEYVSLGYIEAELMTNPLVEHICVYGDSYKTSIVAVVVPNPQSIGNIAANLGITNLSHEELCVNPKIENAVLQELVDQATKSGLQKFEIPCAVKLCAEPWSPDSGLVSAFLKIKRVAVQQRFQHEIDRMYASLGKK